MKLIYKLKQYFRNSSGIVKKIYVFLSLVKHGVLYKNALAKIPHKFGKKNPDKKIYVISVDHPFAGIGPVVFDVLAYLGYAEKRDYTPVIDLKQHFASWTGQETGVNAWEYYFVQPTEVSVEEAYQSQRVYIANPTVCPLSGRYYSFDMYDNQYAVKSCLALFRKYCHYKEDLQQYIENEKQKVFQKGRRILGCSIRMGYVQLQQENHPVYDEHPIQPNNLDIFIEDLKKYLEEWGCDYIFLSTDDRGAVEYLKGFFGDQLLYLERERHLITQDNQVVTIKTSRESISNPTEVRVKGNYAYIAELEILSKCQCYLCGINSGSAMVHMLNNNQFEHTHIYQLGKFEYHKQEGE